MANGKQSQDNIAKYLSRLSELIRILNAGSDYGINEYSENIVARIMSLSFNTNIVNANYKEGRLTEGIDLISLDNSGISVQVSSTYKIDKIHDSISKYFKYGWYKDYKYLYVYMLVGKQNSYSDKALQKTIDSALVELEKKGEIKNKQSIEFTIQDNLKIIDSTDVFKKARGLSLDKKKELELYLEEQLCDEKLIQKRIRVLHIKGYMYDSLKNNFYDELSTELISQLSKQEKIDLVCFSGDLVKDGSQKEAFQQAKLFIEKLEKELFIKKENIAICAGIHDLDYNLIQPSIQQYIKRNIVDNKSLNSFINKNEVDFESSKKRLKNINSTIQNYYNKSSVIADDLYSINKVEINDYKIAIISLNSAWLSSNDNRDKLLYPLTLLEGLIDEIKNYSCKILHLHHPLFDFFRFNFIDLQRIIYSEFDIILTGKEDKTEIDPFYLNQKGIFAHVPCLSLGNHSNNNLGYSILNLDLDTKKVYVQDYIASKSTLTFQEKGLIKIDLPYGKGKNERNIFTLKILDKFDVELENANELLVNYSLDNKKNFLDLFSNPVLSNRPKTAAQIKDKAKKNISIEELCNYDKNLLIYGYDKCGKTSLLRRIQLYHLNWYVYKGTIPFYMDYKDLESRKDEKNLILKEMKKYFSLSHRKTEDLVLNKNVRLIIDNFDANSSITKILIDFLKKYPHVRFIICAEESLSKMIEHINLGTNIDYQVLYLHDLTRKEIRKYSLNWNLYSENKDETINGIIRLCRQLKLPLNYWTISLLFMIHKKSGDNTQKNIYEILNLAIDEMLDKKKIFLEKSQITFDQLKTLCGELAYFLLKEHRNNGYSADRTAIYEFVDKYIKSKKRVTANAYHIITYLHKAGIIKSKGEDYFTFRLNGIFEYFLAWHMSREDNFKKDVLSNDNIYLSFSNELELYSGLNSRDDAFVKEILEKTKTAFSDIYSIERKDEVLDIQLKKKQKDVQEITEAIKEMSSLESIPAELQDELMDEYDPIAIEGDVKEKNIRENLEMSIEVLERYLTTLARVFKNSNDLKSDEFADEVFDFIIKAYAHFGFHLIDEVEGNIKERKDMFDNASNNHMFLIKLLSNFVPLYIQSILYDGIGHFTILDMIKEKIKELEQSSDNNQYELFLLYFLVLDIDLKSNKEIVKKIVQNIKIGSLKISAFFKLNYYRIFKAEKDNAINNYLKKELRELQFKIDPQTSDSSIDTFLDKALSYSID